MNMSTQTHICRDKDRHRDRGRDEQRMEGGMGERTSSREKQNNTLSHGSAVHLNLTMGIPTQHIPVLE